MWRDTDRHRATRRFGPPSMMRRVVMHGGCGRLASLASRAEIERAIETHAATAHQSCGRHDIVCALCGVCFVICNEPTELNRTKKQ
ncbi:hypothetical protein OH687_26905 [Burkholderia anthina]|nr:hypothetical protein OH687_26905 [Burkholderia anthina]